MEEVYSSIVYEKDGQKLEPKKPKWGKQTMLAFVLLLAVLLIIVFVSIFVSKSKEDEVIAEKTVVNKGVIAQGIFSQVEVEADAYVVLDMTSGKIIASKNGEAQLPLASLSKVMTALVVAENLEKNDSIVINSKDLIFDGDNGLVEGEEWDADDLLDFTLVVSSNDGAEALASAVEAVRNKTQKTIRFVDLMNEKAKELGMNQTYFINASGLDIEDNTQSGSYGSAGDISKLFSYAIKRHPDLFEITIEKEVGFTSRDNIRHTVKNTNQNMAHISGMFASKTGFTDLAGGNLMIAFDAGIMQPYIISVLGSSKEGRFEDVEILYNATRRYLEAQNTEVEG